ncbi:MAG: type II toxin-antitoxin system HicB family antitoxin [Nitrospirota bacterium]
MQAIKYFYLDNEKQWLGYLPNFPDHWAQGETFEALQLNLCRLNFDLTLLEALRKVSELSLP